MNTNKEQNFSILDAKPFSSLDSEGTLRVLKMNEEYRKGANKEINKELLPIETRVVHFDDVNTGHGLGTIIAYNGVPANAYLESNFKEAVEMAVPAGLVGCIVASLYDNTRCPYVVQWDNGYKDVYEHSSVSQFDPTNPKHVKAN